MKQGASGPAPERATKELETIMKKFAVLLGTLAFCAGCADYETDTYTETDTPDTTATGTAAPAETGIDSDMAEPMEPIEPAAELEPAEPLGQPQETPGQPQGTPGQPLEQPELGAPDQDQDITITTTNELNIQPEGGQPTPPPNNP